MNQETWIRRCCPALTGKTAAVTGANGGLGREICRGILRAGGNLILVTRTEPKAEALRRELLQEFPSADIRYRFGDLNRPEQVRALGQALKEMPVDLLVLNAGAYCLPREKSSAGFDTVFQINFLSQYYLARLLLPVLEARKGKIAAMGSIAHSGVVRDPADPDFSGVHTPEQVYGNSKRYLMLALEELVRQHPEVQLCIAHPGITFTGITSHYPARYLPLVRHSMRLLFMHPPKAARGMLLGLGTAVPPAHWIGPRVWGIWGNPRIRALTGCSPEERQAIFRDAEAFCRRLSAGSAEGSTAADDPAAQTAAAEAHCG